MIELISYFYANFAEKCVVIWKNLHSWKKICTTAGRDGRDKFQVCTRLCWLDNLVPIKCVVVTLSHANDIVIVDKGL